MSRDWTREEFGITGNEPDAYTKLKQQLAIAVEVIHIIKRQCELLIPKNGLSPVGDRMVMKTFLNVIDRAEQKLGVKFEELEK